MLGASEKWGQSRIEFRNIPDGVCELRWQLTVGECQGPCRNISRNAERREVIEPRKYTKRKPILLLKKQATIRVILLTLMTEIPPGSESTASTQRTYCIPGRSVNLCKQLFYTCSRDLRGTTISRVNEGLTEVGSLIVAMKSVKADGAKEVTNNHFSERKHVDTREVR